MYSIKFFKNLSENNELDKQLTGETLVAGDSRGDINLFQPSIIVKDVEVNQFNYCYIVELKRYYFVENFTIRPNGLAVIQLKVDVLMSFKDDIRASSGLIMKQRQYNPYYGEYDVESRVDVDRYDFPQNVFNYDGEFVIVAMKG